MAWRVCIRVRSGAQAADTVHRLRNLGETLAQICAEQARGEMSFAEIDRATDVLVVSNVKTRDVKHVTALARKSADAAFPEGILEVEAEQV